MLYLGHGEVQLKIPDIKNYKGVVLMLVGPNIKYVESTHTSRISNH